MLSKEELNPKTRGKVHFYDSEDSEKYYRRNINKEIIRAYSLALEYATGRLRDYCNSRGANYILVPSDEPLERIFFDKLPTLGLVK